MVNFSTIKGTQLTFLEPGKSYALGEITPITTPDSLTIIGIDPARTTGYCIIEVIFGADSIPTTGYYIIENKTICSLTYAGEMLDKKSQCFEDRLKGLIEKTKGIIKRRKPHIMALESGFLGINRKGSLMLAELRGMFKTLAILHNIEFFEFAPSTIRKAVCGNGKAKKPELKQAVCKIFPHLGIEKVSEDITDAIGAALCFVGSVEW
jgi:crossover junction endodeoxyribonuclease RuvC